MKTLEQQLINYALYHRSKRNVLTHFIGIPLIVYAILCLLERITLFDGIIQVTGASLVVTVTSLYYLRLSLSLGVIMALLLSLLTIAAAPVASLSHSNWLIVSVATLAVGWGLQFIGHYFEGKKPAFVDDLMGLIIGPLFVVVEALFSLGFYKKLEQQITAQAGSTRV
ncbi:MAG: DUF962 domain-containing protein [Pseudoalteromonas sp.]|uniref:Mpo1 family 2-hydroxy fatty acid dioxygenase n=1 Tax=unclassified Pseudoalteromonas TaxID=194690 RepID=UPI003F9E7063